ncbi:hypothetical protein ABZ154_15530 [Streptomyces sp. NPDC006261]|uniref:hypothetical protein n=1 Tax=Streptomyces sp. NPDC006261 TaxID=3156739 RepID=UPI0033A0372A
MTDTPMTPDRDPSRREELLFMLLHGGARDETIAQRIVDLALAEARAEQKAEVDRLRKALSGAASESSAALSAMQERAGRWEANWRAERRMRLEDNTKLRTRETELETAESRLTAVEMLAEEARDKCNHTVDTDLLLDALGLES